MSSATASVPALRDDVWAARQGDRQAFGRLVDATRTLVCSIALATVRDVARSEDVAQNVLLAVWRGLPGLRDPDSFLPWLRQLTRNQAHQSLRDTVRQRVHAQGDHAFSQDEAAPADLQLLREEDHRILCEALEAVPDDAREVLTLFYREGHAVRQVAALLDLSEAAVKKRLQRARDLLRDEVAARFADVVARTAPGAAFSGAIIAAVGLTAPSTAAAAATGMKAAGAASGVIASSMILPTLVGVLGIVLPLRTVMKGAIDERERRDLRRLGAMSVAAVFVFMGAMSLSLASRSVVYLVAGFALMQAVFGIGYGTWLPRIVARRQAAERAADPAAAHRHRRQRLWSLFGLTVGSVAGTIAVWQAALRILGH